MRRSGFQPAAASSCAATLSKTSSQPCAPTSWTPTGTPAAVAANGRLIAGCPVTFQMRTRALKRPASSVTPACAAHPADRRREPGERGGEQHLVRGPAGLDAAAERPQPLGGLEVVDERHRRRVDEPRAGRRLELLGIHGPAVQALEHADQMPARAGRERRPARSEGVVVPGRDVLDHLVAERLERAGGGRGGRGGLLVDRHSERRLEAEADPEPAGCLAVRRPRRTSPAPGRGGGRRARGRLSRRARPRCP